MNMCQTIYHISEARFPQLTFQGQSFRDQNYIAEGIHDETCPAQPKLTFLWKHQSYNRKIWNSK